MSPRQREGGVAAHGAATDDGLRDAEACQRTQQLFATERFRVYTSDDVVGVELGGALKNVIAIAAGICDGASSLVVADAQWAEQRGLQPIARLAGWGVSGCDPTIMGIGPVPASKRAMEMTGLGLGDMALVELWQHAYETELGLIDQADRIRTNI